MPTDAKAKKKAIEKAMENVTWQGSIADAIAIAIEIYENEKKNKHPTAVEIVCGPQHSDAIFPERHGDVLEIGGTLAIARNTQQPDDCSQCHGEGQYFYEGDYHECFACKPQNSQSDKFAPVMDEKAYALAVHLKGFEAHIGGEANKEQFRREMRQLLDMIKSPPYLSAPERESGERASINVGRYEITEPYSGQPNHIAIYCDGGEGGDFSRDKLEEVIAAFYKEHF